VTGSTLQEIYEARIRSPHAIDFYLGLPAEHETRYLTVQPHAGEGEPPLPEPGSLYAIAINLHADKPTNVYTFPNDRLVREKGQSSAAGIGNARGLARMYAAAIGLEGHEPLLNEATIDTITTRQESGLDMVFGFESHFLLGFADLHAGNPALSPRPFGHNGAVGSLAFADPEAGLAYGYTRRRFLPPHKETDVDNAALIVAMVEAARSI
jgi:CubicO group peptidase (beta-lactamase class C family)